MDAGPFVYIFSLRSLTVYFVPVILPPRGLLCLGLWPANLRSLILVFAVRTMDSWEPSYLLCSRWGLLSGCVDVRPNLGLRLLVYCGYCCGPDNLLYCRLPLIFVWHSWRGAPHHVSFRFLVRRNLYLLLITTWRSCDGETLMLIHDKDYFMLMLIYYTKLSVISKKYFFAFIW